jgi:PleD family two-component response regulator
MAGEALKLLDELCSERITMDLAVDPPIRILVADADPNSLQGISDATQVAFGKPECVDGSEKAVALATEKEFDLIILDALLPGTDGLTACSKIRANGPNRQAPILLVHSTPNADELAQSAHRGGAELVAKPVVPAEINLKVLTLAFRARLEQVKAADAAEASDAAPAEELAVAGK